MLWRVRTTLADRPGTLAVLARRCGEQSVNILGLQIFPGVRSVTDELVLRSPEGWTPADVTTLVDSSGGTEVTVRACTEQALVDGPVRYLHALRAVLHGALTRDQALAGLLDAGAPLTATEHARAAAFTETLDDLVDRGPTPQEGVPGRQGPPTTSAEEVVVREASHAEVGRTWVAVAGDTAVGFATISPVDDGRAFLSLLVEGRWRRRGIGTQLLAVATRQAAEDGAERLVMRGPAEGSAVIALVFASGLRARLRLSGDELVVTIATRGFVAAPEHAPVPDATVFPARPAPA